MEAVALLIGTNLSDGDDGLGQEATVRRDSKTPAHR